MDKEIKLIKEIKPEVIKKQHGYSVIETNYPRKVTETIENMESDELSIKTLVLEKRKHRPIKIDINELSEREVVCAVLTKNDKITAEKRRKQLWKLKHLIEASRHYEVHIVYVVDNLEAIPIEQIKMIDSLYIHRILGSDYYGNN